MKKTTTILAATAISLISLAPSAAVANVHVEFPEDFEPLTVKVTHQKVSDIAKTGNKIECTDDVVEELPVVRQVGYIILVEDTPARYSIDFDNGESAVFYAAPDEQLSVEILNVAPLLYKVSGSELTEGWTDFEREGRPVLMGVKALNELTYPDPAQVKEYNDALEKLVDNYVKANPEKSSAVAALLNLHGQEFLDAYAYLSPAAHGSIMYPMAETEYLNDMAAIESPVEGPELAEE